MPIDTRRKEAAKYILASPNLCTEKLPLENVDCLLQCLRLTLPDNSHKRYHSGYSANNFGCTYLI